MKNGRKDFFLRMAIYFWLVAVLTALCGCAGTTKAVTASASGKNIDLSGFAMLGEIETVNPETATPQGRTIIGRVAYKSRKVGIPADQKVPTAGNFKATKTKSLFGTEEIIIEYDFTAGSEEDAKKALDALEKKRKEAEQAFSEKSVSAADQSAKSDVPK